MIACNTAKREKWGKNEGGEIAKNRGIEGRIRYVTLDWEREGKVGYKVLEVRPPNISLIRGVNGIEDLRSRSTKLNQNIKILFGM